MLRKKRGDRQGSVGMRTARSNLQAAEGGSQFNIAQWVSASVPEGTGLSKKEHAKHLGLGKSNGGRTLVERAPPWLGRPMTGRDERRETRVVMEELIKKREKRVRERQIPEKRMKPWEKKIAGVSASVG